MRIIQVHNWHRFGGGSEAVVQETTRLLRENNHEVLLEVRDSRELGRGVRGRVLAFLCGIYCPSGREAMARLVREYKPDIVHAHELYPFFSPWALLECRRAGVPVVMTCHDYNLTCPITTHTSNGVGCQLCVGGREFWCVLRNCRSNVFESIGYALRHAVGRKWRLFADNVTCYVAPSDFVKIRLVEAGFPEEIIFVVPNIVSVPEWVNEASKGEYIAYVGRICSEKGIETLLTSARQNRIPVRLAGDYSPMPRVVRTAPKNVHFMGHLDRKRLFEFYRKARFLVVPSRLPETFGLVAAEAMGHGLPVIASKIGALPDIVEDGVTGLLFEPGNSAELASKITMLWEDRSLCRKLGLAGREKVIREYSEEVYYHRLLAAYEKAIEINKNENNKGINPPN
jgi:glycosyltransferase involved in cell wall biosynthesis